MSVRFLVGLGVAGWVALFWTTLLLLGSWGPLQLETAGAIGLAGAAALVVAARLGGLRYGFRARWLRKAAGVPLQVVVDFGILALALARALAGAGVTEGVFRTKPLPERSRGYRAFLGVAAGYSPNAYVVEIDAERREVLVHDLVPNERSESPA